LRRKRRRAAMKKPGVFPLAFFLLIQSVAYGLAQDKGKLVPDQGDVLAPLTARPLPGDVMMGFFSINTEWKDPDAYLKESGTSPIFTLKKEKDKDEWTTQCPGENGECNDATDAEKNVSCSKDGCFECTGKYTYTIACNSGKVDFAL
jgi:hypothetical protein